MSKKSQNQPSSLPSSTTHKAVRIAATSDLHGNTDGLLQVCREKDVDILIIAGDIQPADIYYHCNETACKQWFRNKFFRLIEKLPCEVVVIPGNHDFHLKYMCDRYDDSHWYDAIEAYHIPDNFHLLVDVGIEVKGLKIYGTPWVPWISGHWCYEGTSKQLEARFHHIPKNLDVLITHTPPRLGQLDISLERDPKGLRKFGSEELSRELLLTEPRLVFCGHIHSGSHNEYCIGNPEDMSKGRISIYNVSRVDEKYYIGFPITVVDVMPDSIRQIQ